MKHVSLHASLLFAAFVSLTSGCSFIQYAPERYVDRLQLHNGEWLLERDVNPFATSEPLIEQGIVRIATEDNKNFKFLAPRFQSNGLTACGKEIAEVPTPDSDRTELENRQLESERIALYAQLGTQDLSRFEFLFTPKGLARCPATPPPPGTCLGTERFHLFGTANHGKEFVCIIVILRTLDPKSPDKDQFAVAAFKPGEMFVSPKPGGDTGSSRPQVVRLPSYRQKTD